MISCAQCQTYLIAYVQRDIGPTLSHLMADHLDHCDACYRLFWQEKRLVNDLQLVMPTIGHDRAPSFERVWTAIQMQSVQRSYPSLQYGIAMLSITLLMLLPFALGKGNQVLAAPPTQPPPIVRIVPRGTIATDESIAVAYKINQTPAPADPPSIISINAISTP